MTNWKDVLTQKKETLAKLEAIADANDFQSLVTEIENPFADETADDLFTTDCNSCDTPLFEEAVVQQSNDDVEVNYCNLQCVVADTRNQISNLKLFMPDVERLASEQE